MSKTHDKLDQAIIDNEDGNEESKESSKTAKAMFSPHVQEVISSYDSTHKEVIDLKNFEDEDQSLV
jgi:hypothetical protein